MKRIRWLTTGALEAIHHELIARYGGLGGVRDFGSLESALARPKHLSTYRFGVSVPELAAAYGWGLLRNHPFLDGNKRIALAAMVVFLELNEWQWLASELEETSKVLAASERQIGEREWNLWVASKSSRNRQA